MTTTFERLVTEPKYDPSILLPNVWSDLFRCVEAQCPCGSTTRVRDGALTRHEPRSEWTIDGQRRAMIRDAYDKGPGAACRYTDRTVTLEAALARDNALTPAEKNARDVTHRLLEAGVTFTAPEGYALPKPAAGLFALAEASGWTVKQAWTPRDGGFALDLLVGRRAGDGRVWDYRLTYFVAPGVARRTRFGLSRTPDRRAPHDTPSVKAIQAVITANPVEG